MASSVSSPRAIPFVTDGTLLLHADFLLLGIVMTFLGPMLPQFSARWSLTDAGAGSLIFAEFFSSMFGMLLSGVSVVRLGYRLTLIIGLLLMACGVTSLASGPWLQGIIAVCIFGVGYGITSPAGNLRTAEINPERSASALNVINAVWGLGAMSSPFLVAIALHNHHPSFFLYGTAAALFALLTTLAISRFVPDIRVHAGDTNPNRAHLWRRPILPLICLLFFVYVGTETCFGNWVTTYARRIETGPRSLATMMPSFFWGALLLGRALAPLALKFRHETTVALGGLICAVLGGTALITAHGVPQIIIGSILAGLGLASIFPISVSLLPRWFGDSAHHASSVVFASGNTGGAVMPWLLGAVSAHYSSLRLAFSIPLAGAVAMLAFYLLQSPSQDAAPVVTVQ
ncbi:MAG TPA: MFS transporter [Terriglobales bacterium]|nr:MFS transporter [Terriglobales bacterium]